MCDRHFFSGPSAWRKHVKLIFSVFLTALLVQRHSQATLRQQDISKYLEIEQCKVYLFAGAGHGFDTDKLLSVRPFTQSGSYQNLR